jgi:hypothetical protein
VIATKLVDMRFGDVVDNDWLIIIYNVAIQRNLSIRDETIVIEDFKKSSNFNLDIKTLER